MNLYIYFSRFPYTHLHIYFQKWNIYLQTLFGIIESRGWAYHLSICHMREEGCNSPTYNGTSGQQCFCLHLSLGGYKLRVLVLLVCDWMHDLCCTSEEMNKAYDNPVIKNTISLSQGAIFFGRINIILRLYTNMQPVLPPQAEATEAFSKLQTYTVISVIWWFKAY